MESINNKKGDISIAFVLGIVIAVVIIVFFGIGVSKCTGSYESQQAAESFASLVKTMGDVNDKPSGTRESILFTADDDSAIFGFAKDADKLEWRFIGPTGGVPLMPDVGSLVGFINRPIEKCPIDKSCICLCSNVKHEYNRIAVANEFLCGEIKCAYSDFSIRRTKAFEMVLKKDESERCYWKGGFGFFRENSIMAKAYYSIIQKVREKEDFRKEALMSKTQLFIEKQGEDIAICQIAGCA